MKEKQEISARADALVKEQGAVIKDFESISLELLALQGLVSKVGSIEKLIERWKYAEQQLQIINIKLDDLSYVPG